MKSFLKEIESKFTILQEQDQDGDKDQDFADVQIARMVASGMSKEDAIAKVKSKKYNEEAKPDFLDLDNDGDKKETMKQAAAQANEATIEVPQDKLAQVKAQADDDDTIKVVDEELEEQNVTGALDGGAGPPRTPYAFGKKKRKYTYASVSEAMDQKYAAMIESYSKFSTGNPKLSPSQTVNGSIKEVAKKLQEIEQIVKYTSRLKNESGIAGSTYGKSTHSALRKISERLLKISERVRSLGE
tara:strand:+ start:1282 stop:2010 length:729 start_codon:yes stop_codon:yes gene_type:complete